MLSQSHHTVMGQDQTQPNRVSTFHCPVRTATHNPPTNFHEIHAPPLPLLLPPPPSAADAASARATCVRCQCSLMDSAFQAGLRGSTGSGKCLTAQAMPAVSEAMLKAIASPECQVPDSELAAKCPNLDPRLALALAKTGTGAQTGAGAKSGAGSAARVSLGAAWMLVVLLVLL